jgi:hypothetical protein
MYIQIAVLIDRVIGLYSHGHAAEPLLAILVTEIVV